jgi:hypothetical protein
MTLMAAAMIVGAASYAQAIPPILRPGSRPMWASMTLGPAVKVSDWITQFKMTQTFGYHFKGTANGPAIAADLQESFGDDWIVFCIVPRFVWDIQIVDGLGLYLSPSGGFGFAHASVDCPAGYTCPSYNGFTFQFAFEGKLVLGDRGLVFFRPIGFDIMGLANGDMEVGARYELFFGGGVIF